ncbi:MAG: response regulator, partial [Deltaproteobacteria bacterium]|nr:response regulator [Deltaproteobacteria bacterium]
MSNVLIIDSLPADHDELAAHLSHVGHTCQRIAGGSEGLAMARENPPELIILAVELDRVSGYAICNKFKKDPNLKEVPLILVSAQATPGDFAQHQKLKTHADGYVHKPYSLEQMVGLLGRYISSEEDEDIDIGDVDATMAISVDDLEQALAARSGASEPEPEGEELDIELDLDLDLDMELEEEPEGDFSALLQDAKNSETEALAGTPEVL